MYPKYYSDGTQARSFLSLEETVHGVWDYSEALQAKLGTLSLEAQTKLEKDTAKKEAKAEAKADAAKKKKMVSTFRVCRWLPLIFIFIV